MARRLTCSDQAIVTAKTIASHSTVIKSAGFPCGGGVAGNTILAGGYVIWPLTYGHLIIMAAITLTFDFIVVNFSNHVPAIGYMAGITGFSGAYMIYGLGRGTNAG